MVSFKQSSMLTYLYGNEFGTIGLWSPWRYRWVVRKIGVIWASAKQVEDDDGIEGKHRDRQVPAIKN